MHIYHNNTDGIMLRSSQLTSGNDRNNSGLRLITANKSIKISSLNPIMNIIKRNKESEKTTVYYFEVFVISGDCAVGFVPALLDNNSHHHDAILHNHSKRRGGGGGDSSSSSIAVGNCGHLIRHPDAEFPLLRNNSLQNGETIGCGILFGTVPTYFFTHNGVRIDVEALYGIDSRVSSLQIPLVPTVALSNSIETVVRTNFGFCSDTPFLWNGNFNNNNNNNNFRIISKYHYGGGGGGGPTLPPHPSSSTNLGGGTEGGNTFQFPPRLSYLPSRSTSRDESVSSLLTDEIFPLPNFTRGNTVSGAITGQQQQQQQLVPPIPMVECAAAASPSSIYKFDGPISPPRRQRRRVSLPDMSHAELSNGMVHGSSALPPPLLKGSQFMEEEELSAAAAPPLFKGSQFMEEEELSAAAPPLFSSAFGKSIIATDMEIENTRVENDFDLIDARELATELSRATSETGTNESSVSQLMAVCQSKLGQLNDKITNSTGEDFGELLSVHDVVTEAINGAENWTRNLESRRRTLLDMNESTHSLSSATSEQLNTGEKSEAPRDIFGLLCHLRGREEETRIKATRSLLRVTRRGESHHQRQILQSGGIWSLLTLFKSSTKSPVLMTLSALNVVHLTPSYTDPVSNKTIMAAIDCFYYLIQSSGLDAGADFDITPAEVFKGCMNAMTFVWMNCIEPKLCSSDTSLDGEMTNCFEMQRSRPKRRSFQDEDDVDNCHVLDSFTSLAVMSATIECNDVDGPGKSVCYGFADILQSICAVESCRGLVMKEGVLNILLKWMRSRDNKLELIAATALRDLTVSHSSYTAGWVHSELLHDGNAIGDIVERLSAPNLEVKICMAEIVSCLSCVPHTRVAIIDAQGIKYLGQVLATVEMGCEDDRVNVAVGNSLLNLAIGSGVYSNCGRPNTRATHGCILQ